MQEQQHSRERQDQMQFCILALFPRQLNKSALKLATPNAVGVAESDVGGHGLWVPIHGYHRTSKASPRRR